MSFYPSDCPKCFHGMTKHVYRKNMAVVDCLEAGCGCRITELEILSRQGPTYSKVSPHDQCIVCRVDIPTGGVMCRPCQQVAAALREELQRQGLTVMPTGQTLEDVASNALAVLKRQIQPQPPDKLFMDPRIYDDFITSISKTAYRIAPEEPDPMEKAMQSRKTTAKWGGES